MMEHNPFSLPVDLEGHKEKIHYSDSRWREVVNFNDVILLDLELIDRMPRQTVPDFIC